MTKLISGRVKKIKSANVSASRYNFIGLSETEPDLGVPAANGYLLAANADGTRFWTSVGGVSAGISLDTFTTANLNEGSNLYYTNVRVISAVTGTTLSNLTISGNVNVGGIITANEITANIWNGLYTANVVESASNLYYTNARVISAVSNTTISNLTVSGNIVVDNITANIITANIWQGIYTANVIESDSNLYYTNSRVYSNVIQILNGLGLASQLTTDKVNETSNLYYTNARVIAAVTNTTLNVLTVNNIFFGNLLYTDGLNSIITGANLIQTNYLETGNLIVRGIDVTQELITNNVTSQITTSDAITSNTINVSGNITTNVITANIWNGLYTANVIESDSNLYYTNARVYSNVIQLLSQLGLSTQLTTDKVNETSNLYYTNARVIAAVTNTTLSNLTTDAITANIWNGLYTSNVIESAANLYYTNARVYANVQPLLVLKANVADLTTANVVESASNLYYTNARVIAAVSNATISNLTISGNVNVGGNVITNTIFANVWQGLYTGNIIESGNTDSGNVFFSNARARNAISAADNTIVYDPITGTIRATANVTATVTATIDGLTTANVSEKASSGNLYYTNARVYSNVIELLGSLGLSAGNNFNTDQVREAAGTSNLYYSNARGRTAITGGTGVSYSNVTGIISIGQNVSTTANVQFNNLRVDGNTTFYGNTSFYGNVTTYASNNLSVSDNMIYLNSSSTASNPDLGFAGNYNDGSYKHAGFFRDATDSTWKVFDSYTPEPDASQFIDTAHASFKLANLTANIVTASGYFVGNGALLTGITTSVNNVNGNLTVTGNVIANATIIANAFISRGNITAGNLNVLGNIFGNGLIINGTEIITGGATETTLRAANIFAGNVGVNIITANVIRVAGNVFGNLSVLGNVIANGLIVNGIEVITGGATETSLRASNIFAGNILVNRISSNIWTGLYSANIIESSSNLFYTNTRVYSNIIQLLPTLAGQNIEIAANGQIRANITSISGNLAGNLRVSGNIIANGLIINGTEFVSGTSTGLIISSSNVNAGNVNVNRINANVISVSGNVAGNLRVLGNITANGLIIQGTDVTQTLLTGNLVAQSSTSNVLFANSVTVIGNVIVGGNIISNATVIANAFISRGNITAFGNITANGLIVNGTEVVTGGTTDITIRAANITANLITANVLVVTGNVRGNLNVLGNITANGIIINGTEVVTGGTNEVSIRAANITANIITANIWNRLYTTNVIEAGSNLYFTNTRAVSAFSAGAGINLYANGLIEGGVLSLSDSQYFTSASFVYGVGVGTTNVSLSTSVSDSRRIIVSIDGLVQTPTLDYYVNGTALAFNSNISLNSVIEVKYFGNEAIYALSFNPFLFASL